MSNTDIKSNFDPALNIGESLEQELLAEIKRLYPEASKRPGKFKDFDIQIPELYATLEVKSDRKSDYTQNFGFEYRCWGKPSGLSTTTSDGWIMADKDCLYCFNTVKLKDFLRTNWKFLKTDVKGGDNMASVLVLVRKDDAANNSFCVVLRRGEIDLLLLRAFLRSLDKKPND